MPGKAQLLWPAQVQYPHLSRVHAVVSVDEESMEVEIVIHCQEVALYGNISVGQLRLLRPMLTSVFDCDASIMADRYSQMSPLAISPNAVYRLRRHSLYAFIDGPSFACQCTLVQWHAFSLRWYLVRTG